MPVFDWGVQRVGNVVEDVSLGTQPKPGINFWSVGIMNEARQSTSMVVFDVVITDVQFLAVNSTHGH